MRWSRGVVIKRPVSRREKQAIRRGSPVLTWTSLLAVFPVFSPFLARCVRLHDRGRDLRRSDLALGSSLSVLAQRLHSYIVILSAAACPQSFLMHSHHRLCWFLVVLLASLHSASGMCQSALVGCGLLRALSFRPFLRVNCPDGRVVRNEGMGDLKGFAIPHGPCSTQYMVWSRGTMDV